MISQVTLFTTDKHTPPKVMEDVKKIWANLDSNVYEWFGECDFNRVMYPNLHQHLLESHISYCFIQSHL